MLVSVVSGSLAVLFGLLLSFHYGTAGGATIAVISVLQFFVVLGGQSLMQMLRNWRQRNDLEPEVV